ncbi:MAG: hypothetical protein GXO48_07480 [Chlorobi bacterium]|nr:hypothetical protein [Chlorobiota bacterium]
MLFDLGKRRERQFRFSTERPASGKRFDFHRHRRFGKVSWTRIIIMAVILLALIMFVFFSG